MGNHLSERRLHVRSFRRSCAGRRLIQVLVGISVDNLIPPEANEIIAG